MADTSLVFDILARDKASSKLDKVKASAKLLGVAVGVMAVKFGKDSVSAFVEAEAAQDKLQFALDKFPKLADTNIDRLGKLNSSLAKKTKFDDDATASGQAVLGQFVDTGKQLEDLTPLMQDFAAKTGRDLPTAAGLTGKAFLGNTRALKDLGINYKATGDKTQDMANITELMREKVGGFAEKEGKSAAGQGAILENQFGEIQETVGSKLVPVLVALAGALLGVVGFIQENGAVIGPLVGILAGLAGVVWLIITAQKAWIAVQTVLNIVMAANPIVLVVLAVVALVAAVVLAYQHSETFRDIVQGAMKGVVVAFGWVVDKATAVFGWVKDHWPLLLGILTGPFGLAIALIATHWGTIKDKASAMVGVIGDIVSALWDPIKAGFAAVRDWVSGRWDAFREWVTGWSPGFGALWGGIKDAWTAVREWVMEKWAGFRDTITSWAPNFGGMFDGIKDAFRSAVNTIIGWWNNLSFGLPGFDPPGPGPKFGGFNVGTPNIPMLAQGGIVTRPTLIMAGEAGAEAIVPLTGRRAPVGGGITIQNLTLPNVTDAPSLVRELQDYAKRNGPIRGLI